MKTNSKKNTNISSIIKPAQVETKCNILSKNVSTNATKVIGQKNNIIAFPRLNPKGNIMNHKRQILEQFLSEGKTMIIIDSTKPGVSLPTHLMNLLQVKLNLSYKFATTVFEISDEKIIVDLSFASKKFDCVIPLDSIYYIALADSLEGVPFLEDMPEIFIQMAQELEELEELEEEEAPNQIDFLSNIPIESSKKIVNHLRAPVKRATTTARKTKIKDNLQKLKNNEIKFNDHFKKK
jgi:stringent starvation protein B